MALGHSIATTAGRRLERMSRMGLSVALALALPASLAAQAPAVDGPPADMAAKVAEVTAAAEAGGAGRFKAEMLTDPGLPTHTIYRPRDLAAATARGKLPIIVWGNGACVNIGNRFRYFLTEVASHGYLVIAIGPIAPHAVEWKVSLTPDNAPPPTERPPASYAAQLGDAIDWALVENARKASPYFGRLDKDAIAVMGQSCGGLQAISAAADKRVKTLMVLNSGTFPDGSKPLAGTGDAIKASLRRIHLPVAWISGDDSDIAFTNANADFDAFATGPALRAWHAGTGHSAHWRDLHGGLFTPLVVDWLDWRLKHRAAAARTFTGADCKLCRTPGWTVQRKGF